MLWNPFVIRTSSRTNDLMILRQTLAQPIWTKSWSQRNRLKHSVQATKQRDTTCQTKISAPMKNKGQRLDRPRHRKPESTHLDCRDSSSSPCRAVYFSNPKQFVVRLRYASSSVLQKQFLLLEASRDRTTRTHTVLYAAFLNSVTKNKTNKRSTLSSRLSRRWTEKQIHTITQQSHCGQQKHKVSKDQSRA